MAPKSPSEASDSTNWANGPASAQPVQQQQTDGQEKDPASVHHRAQVGAADERVGRSSSPPRRERSRSPARSSARSNDVVNPGNNLHVSGVSSRVEDQDLEELFGKYGKVQKLKIMRDPHTQDSRGFGFVTMEVLEEAEAAIVGLNGHEFMGRPLCVEKARRSRGRTPTPGQYYGPPKRDDRHRPYESRGVARYDPYDRPYDDRRGRHDDRRYDRCEEGRDDRYRDASPRRERYDDRYSRRRDDRDYDRRRY